MGADYIPERDFDTTYWMRNFVAQLVANGPAYRVNEADVEDVSARVLAFRIAYQATVAEPGTQSSSLIRTKNNARKSAEQIIRPISQRIRRDREIDNALKALIGLPSPAKRRKHVGPPDSSPLLIVRTSGVSSRAEIMVLDSITQRRARPKDAIGIELYERVRPLEALEAMKRDGIRRPADSIDQFRFIGMFSRWPIVHYPDMNRAGDEVSLVARWITRRGEYGPFGQTRTYQSNFNPVDRMSKANRLAA